MKKAISTDKAPAAIGPYSQAIEVNGMVYTSGVIPVVPSTGEIPEGAAAQADQAIGNLAALLKEAGTSTERQPYLLKIWKTLVPSMKFMQNISPVPTRHVPVLKLRDCQKMS